MPKNKKQNDSVMVLVDKLSKVTHFIPIKTTHKVANNVDIFMKEFFRLHGIPKVIIFDSNLKFFGNFWKSLFKGLDTKLNFSIAYHMQLAYTQYIKKIIMLIWSVVFDLIYQNKKVR